MILVRVMPAVDVSHVHIGHRLDQVERLLLPDARVRQCADDALRTNDVGRLMRLTFTHHDRLGTSFALREHEDRYVVTGCDMLGQCCACPEFGVVGMSADG
jgi:hypothetical protein